LSLDDAFWVDLEGSFLLLVRDLMTEEDVVAVDRGGSLDFCKPEAPDLAWIR